MSVVMLIIGTLWLLQVVFLDEYYLHQKSKDIVADTTVIVDQLSQTNLASYNDVIGKIAIEKTMCIDIYSELFGTVTYEGLGDNCYIHMSLFNKNDILQQTLARPGDFVVTKVEHERYDTQYNICSIVTDSATNGKQVVTVTATLAPIAESAILIKKQLIYISLILTLVATAVAFFLSRSLTKPIVKMTNAAREIASGNLGVDVFVRSNDEIGELSQSFGYMTKELAKVSTLQRELVANISHDIRTPLTMIRGYAEAIKDITGDNKELREHQLDIIVNETVRLGTMVNDVLDLSLMQAGQQQLNLSSFDLVATIQSILTRFELFELNDGFVFTLESVPNLPVIVQADSTRIEQVLYNLIGNAVNHIGEEKHINITVSQKDNHVRVEIADTGTGIAREDLPLIWDRYYKPYKKGETKSIGTGLGLSIVKAILINHSADFGVNSTLGVGSTFWFELQKSDQSLLGV